MMIFIDNLSKKEYTHFSDNHKKAHFLQSYAWGEFCKKGKNQIPKYVGMKNSKGILVATALILLKKMPLGYSYGYCPRGFLIDYENKKYIKDFTIFLKKYMKDNKIIYIKFDPDIKYQDIDENACPIKGGKNNYDLYKYLISLGYKHGGFYKLYNGNQPRYTFRINLKKDKFEEVEDCFDNSFKKSIKRSYQYDLEIDNNANAAAFYDLMKLNSAKDGFNPRSCEYYKYFTEEFSKDNKVKFFNVKIKPKKILSKINNEIKEKEELLKTATKKQADINNQLKRLNKEKNEFSKYDVDEMLICSLICVYAGNYAWSLYIGNNELGNLTFAVSRSYYEAIKDSFDRGFSFFDLFGTIGDPKTNYKNLANLHDFKRKFGDEYIEFIGEFDLVNKKFLYKILPVLLKIYRKLKK